MRSSQPELTGLPRASRMAADGDSEVLQGEQDVRRFWGQGRPRLSLTVHADLCRGGRHQRLFGAVAADPASGCGCWSAAVGCALTTTRRWSCSTSSTRVGGTGAMAFPRRLAAATSRGPMAVGPSGETAAPEGDLVGLGTVDRGRVAVLDVDPPGPPANDRSCPLDRRRRAAPARRSSRPSTTCRPSRPGGGAPPDGLGACSGASSVGMIKPAPATRPCGLGWVERASLRPARRLQSLAGRSTGDPPGAGGARAPGAQQPTLPGRGQPVSSPHQITGSP